MLYYKKVRCSIEDNISKLGVDFTNNFGAKAEQLLRKEFLILSEATAFGKNAPKCGAQCKSCSVKLMLNFSRNVGETDQHLLWHLLYAGTCEHCTNSL
jgi:hypothetical protein